MEHRRDTYENVEEPSHAERKWRRKMKCSEDIYANASRMNILEPHNTGAALSGGGGVKRRSCRAAAVCLGLLSLLLLTGLITLLCLYTEGNSVWRREKDLLERRYNNLTEEQEQLQTSYNNMTRERDQLQASFNNLTRERDQLQTNYTSLTRERNDLLTKLQGWTNQGGWVYFSSKFYYISFMSKSWQESRNDCQRRGADLVIINSKEEQDFTRSFKRLMWIGLTDGQAEGTWTWVDGTPLTKSYWVSGEPNGRQGRDEDCAEIMMYDSENSWNDKSCDLQTSWICEKATSP